MIFRCLFTGFCLVSSVWAQGAVEILPLPPDPCVSTAIGITPPASQSFDLNRDGLDETRIYTPANPFPGQRLKPLALIINGNGFNLGHYADLAIYLTGEGFHTVVVQRFGSTRTTPEAFVLEALQFAFLHLNLPADTPVALIGHSIGGGVAVQAAQLNASRAGGFRIKSLVALAPNVDEHIPQLQAGQVGAYLLVYGSQDQDVEGLGSEPSDAFGAYDRAGTEASTTCHNQFCQASDAMDRTMVFIHGADHKGLINQPSTCGLFCEFPFHPFLGKSDQFCIAKGYTNGFLRWTLNNDTRYTRMMRGRYRPPSIASMASDAADELGNPAGTPLRMSLQVSPARRSMIENFEDGVWSVAGSTPAVTTQWMDRGAHLGDAVNIRHWTRLLAVGWPVQGSWQYLGFQTPASKRDVSLLSHIALRVGQLGAGAPAANANSPNAPQSVMIGLSDGSVTRWRWSHEYAAIPQNDRRPDGRMHNVMNTVSIPLSAYSDIQKNHIEAVYLAFPAGSKGTLLIDSLEWFRE